MIYERASLVTRNTQYTYFPVGFYGADDWLRIGSDGVQPSARALTDVVAAADDLTTFVTQKFDYSLDLYQQRKPDASLMVSLSMDAHSRGSRYISKEVVKIVAAAIIHSRLTTHDIEGVNLVDALLQHVARRNEKGDVESVAPAEAFVLKQGGNATDAYIKSLRNACDEFATRFAQTGRYVPITDTASSDNLVNQVMSITGVVPGDHPRCVYDLLFLARLIQLFVGFFSGDNFRDGGVLNYQRLSFTDNPAAKDLPQILLAYAQAVAANTAAQKHINSIEFESITVEDVLSWDSLSHARVFNRQLLEKLLRRDFATTMSAITNTIQVQTRYATLLPAMKEYTLFHLKELIQNKKQPDMFDDALYSAFNGPVTGARTHKFSAITADTTRAYYEKVISPFYSELKDALQKIYKPSDPLADFLIIPSVMRDGPFDLIDAVMIKAPRRWSPVTFYTSYHEDDIEHLRWERRLDDSPVKLHVAVNKTSQKRELAVPRVGSGQSEYGVAVTGDIDQYRRAMMERCSWNTATVDTDREGVVTLDIVQQSGAHCIFPPHDGTPVLSFGSRNHRREKRGDKFTAHTVDVATADIVDVILAIPLTKSLVEDGLNDVQLKSEYESQISKLMTASQGVHEWDEVGMPDVSAVRYYTPVMEDYLGVNYGVARDASWRVLLPEGVTTRAFAASPKLPYERVLPRYSSVTVNLPAGFVSEGVKRALSTTAELVGPLALNKRPEYVIKPTSGSRTSDKYSLTVQLDYWVDATFGSAKRELRKGGQLICARYSYHDPRLESMLAHGVVGVAFDDGKFFDFRSISAPITAHADHVEALCIDALMTSLMAVRLASHSVWSELFSIDEEDISVLKEEFAVLVKYFNEMYECDGTSLLYFGGYADKKLSTFIADGNKLLKTLSTTLKKKKGEGDETQEADDTHDEQEDNPKTPHREIGFAMGPSDTLTDAIDAFLKTYEPSLVLSTLDSVLVPTTAAPKDFKGWNARWLSGAWMAAQEPTLVTAISLDKVRHLLTAEATPILEAMLTLKAKHTRW